MWNAASGRRYFSGNFAKLLATGLDDLIGDILEKAEYDEEVELEVPPFDRLTAEQKIFVLRLVARALFLEEEPEPDLTAVSEGTVDAIFRRVEFLLELEVDETEDYAISFTLRRFITDALADERAYETAKFAAENPGRTLDAETLEDFAAPELESDDFDEWRDALDRLLEQVLWDSDYLCDAMLDVAPEKRAEFGRAFGLAEDYYWRVYDEPKPDEARRIAEEIRDLCDEILAKN